MIYYGFHPDTHEYTVTHVPDLDPLETRIAKRPVYARPGQYETETAPPEKDTWPDKKIPVWDKENAAWTMVADHRGEIWWNASGVEVLIGFLGDPGDHALSAVRIIVKPTPDDVRNHGMLRKRAAVGAVDKQAYEDIVAAGSREAIRLVKIRLENGGWTEQQAARAAQLDAVEAYLDLIDETVSALEVTLPEDFTDDRHWPS